MKRYVVYIIICILYWQQICPMQLKFQKSASYGSDSSYTLIARQYDVEKKCVIGDELGQASYTVYTDRTPVDVFDSCTGLFYEHDATHAIITQLKTYPTPELKEEVVPELREKVARALLNKLLKNVCEQKCSVVDMHVQQHELSFYLEYGFELNHSEDNDLVALRFKNKS